MAGVYFYVPQNELKDIVDCGLKLSEWFDREISLPGLIENKKVLKALLNPRDDEEKLENPAYQCLRLDVDVEYSRVGDSDLYQVGLKEPTLMEAYKSSVIPLRNYRFGTFRNPEVLIMTSVLAEKIEIMGKIFDTPILYESSEKLYLNNIMDKHNETWNDSGNHLLYTFFVFLELQGKVTQFEDLEHGKAIFFYNESKEYTVLRIPKEGTCY